MFKSGIHRRRKFQFFTVCTSAISGLFVLSVTLPSSTPDEYFLNLVRQSLPGSDPSVLALLKQHYITPPSGLPYNFSKDPEYQKSRRGLSWEVINHYLRQFFSNQREGFFVEAGALDGEFLSNSLWLEQNLGWTGILIEPDKKSYLQLLDKHRHSWSSNTCLSTTAYPKETVHVSVKLNHEYKGTKWYYQGSSHEYGVTLDPAYNDFFLPAEESMYIVQCFPLESYLKVLNITTVDVLSLDIQGSEEEVLKTIPWNKIMIKFIVVEVTKEDFSIPNYLRDIGFIWVNRQAFWVEDLMFVRKELLESRQQSVQ